jgi:hypothetical protein
MEQTVVSGACEGGVGVGHCDSHAVAANQWGWLLMTILPRACAAMLIIRRIMHLNKPDTLNSLTEVMAGDFAAALQQLQADSAARALIITGAHMCVPQTCILVGSMQRWQGSRPEPQQCSGCLLVCTVSNAIWSVLRPLLVCLQVLVSAHSVLGVTLTSYSSAWTAQWTKMQRWAAAKAR